MSSQRERRSNSKPKRKLVRYTQTYTFEEESFCSNGSDPDFAPNRASDYESDYDTSQDETLGKGVSSKTKTNRCRKTGLMKKTPHYSEDSPSSQESIQDGSRYPVKRKLPVKKGADRSKKTILKKALAGSKSQKVPQSRDDEDGSDSSLIFTDEISEASCMLKEHHPEMLKKSTLIRKPHVDLVQKNINTKPVKRKDLSASRKASKKMKLNDTDEVEYIPDPIDCITIESDNFSESETAVPAKASVWNGDTLVKTEKNSPMMMNEKIKEEKVRNDVSWKESKYHGMKRTESMEELQSSEYNTNVKSESLRSSINIKPEVPLESASNARIKSETVDSSINVPKMKKEAEDEKSKPTSKSKSKEKPSSKTKTDQKLNIKTEKESQPEIPSTAKSKPVEKNNKNTQKQLGTGIEWESQMLADLMDFDFYLAKNIICLFENDCTIPFIARYRRESTNNMDADQLRQVKCAYEYIKTLEKKTVAVFKKLDAAGKLTKSLENSLLHVRSIEELDYIYAPYKQSSAKSKAEKARSLGLEDPASIVLNGTGEFNPAMYVNPQEEGVKNTKEVIQSVQHILAEIFSKDEAVLEYVQRIENQIPVIIKSKKKSDAVDDDGEKFRIYYDFTKYVRDLQSHQILALNRGENLKILTVKMLVDESFYDKMYRFCSSKWLRFGSSYSLRSKMFEDSFKDSYTRLISPLLIRRTKAKLTRKAQVTAIENFALNLKSLLQTPPVKGCPILGIDPGLRHGVKFALISSQGDVLWTKVFNFEFNELNSLRNQLNMNNIRRHMVEHKCELIAIGNGSGSREIETVISDCLKKNFFSPELNVSYTFVNERGASVYSCSSTAKEEFPDLDPNLISAVFIARSLQDPLSEFVKVEPKHLGVGMYQHDMPEVKLNQSLDEVVMECVSFTGIDLNTASIYLLKRVSGLGATRAANIIKWRQENGPFKNRQQLLLVKNIGPKTFEQCSGFLRIHSQTCNVQVKDIKKKGIPGNTDYNPLDSTWIHPESYNIAYLFMGHCDSNASDLGTSMFIDRIKRVVQLKGLKSIAEILGQSEQTISFIYDALIKPSNYDYRSEFSKPVFSKGLRSLENLNVGDIMQGVVSNVVAFGAFVDIGVGKNGLVHISNMNRMKVQIGDRIEVRILSVEKDTGRIGLFLVKKL